MAKHQLDRPDVHVLRQEAARALLTQVAPVQVDLPQLAAIDACAGFARFVSCPLAIRSNDSQAVLKLATNSPAGDPNTYAFGPRDARRFRMLLFASLLFDATALTIPSSSKRNTEMAEASIHRAESEASPAAVASGRAPKLGG